MRGVSRGIDAPDENKTTNAVNARRIIHGEMS